MNKSLEAFFRGYIFFKVNSKLFFLYNTALKKRKEINGNISFIGWHIIKRWRCFYLRVGAQNEM